ncbi:hypothetical protein N7510_008564 [Penicillium lagena]|uniref:uncharacterized protein n=1 Tax=Penicillium lagena TaxID=94218 RepID=UPI00253F969F|nr:uncharacterized protein N7510_008564 [Penicillium lagena]KAJ5605783.1 hypothetical protein N7510_008564 [Penicillium lagena]
MDVTDISASGHFTSEASQPHSLGTFQRFIFPQRIKWYCTVSWRSPPELPSFDPKASVGAAESFGGAADSAYRLAGGRLPYTAGSVG